MKKEKQTRLLIIIFYTSINKILGLVICLLIIVYYQSDFVQNLLNTDENMENIIAIDNKFKLYDNYEKPETDNDFNEDVEKPLNKSEKVQNIISWLEDVYTLGDNKKDLEINKVQDTFRKENCKDNKLMHKIHDNVAKTIHKVLSDNKAKDITKINLEKKSSIADFMIICSGTSNRHVISLSNYLVEALKKENLNTLNVEGIRNGDWVLVDAGDIIVHLFRGEVREYYGLEKMWAGEEINSYIK